MDQKNINNPQTESVVNQPTAVPVSPTPKPKSKLPLVLVVIVLLVMVGVGGIVLGKYLSGSKTSETVQPVVTVTTTTPTPTADPTANWKTYTNAKYNFSVKYPDSWFSNDCGFTDTVLLLNPKGKPVCETEPYDSIIFNMKPVYVESYTAPDYKVTMEEEKTTPIKYSKFLIEKLQPASGPDKFLVLRALLPGGGMFTITVNDLQYEPVADQIFSTFKFTP